MYIAIEGNIGAGKTELAKKLAGDMQAELVLERFNDNPFLEKFYREPDKHTFTLETSFLLDRFRQLKDLFANDAGNRVVADYLFDKSIVFARHNLDKEQFKLFEELYLSFKIQLPRPDTIVYLQVMPHTLKQNIIARGRSYEQNIPLKYLEGIAQEYANYLKTLQGIPVIYIELGEEALDDEIYAGLKDKLSAFL